MSGSNSIEAPEHADDDLDTVLIRDAVNAAKQSAQSPTELRAAIRAAHAAIEGLISVLQDRILDTPALQLLAEERALLKGTRIVLKDNGIATPIRDKQTLEQRVKFTVNVVKRNDAAFGISYDDDGWQALLRSLKVRDRLMHPKQRVDVNVSDVELHDALDGLTWLFSSVCKPAHGSLHQFGATQNALIRLLRGEGNTRLPLIQASGDGVVIPKGDAANGSKKQEP